MQSLALEFAEPIQEVTMTVEEESNINKDEISLQEMLSKREFSTAFFLSRRLVTRGEDWASEYMNRAKSGLDSDDEVIIP